MKKQREVLVAGLLLVLMGTASAQIQVGGDLKLRMFDWMTGTSTYFNDDSVPVLEDHEGSGHANMGFYAAYLFFAGQLSDKVSIAVEPEIGGRTGATPRIGRDIGDYRPASPEISISKAYMSVMLPWDLEVSAGALRPLFCVDYGAEKWYQEQATITWGTQSGYLGAIHDYGLEVYKPFEFEVGEGSYFSMPTYLYLTSGYGSDEVSDNNGNKQVMAHIEPGIGPAKLFGSVGFGMWDDDNTESYMRYAGGLALNFDPFWLRAEYLGGTWTNRYGTPPDEMFDANPVGYYVKAGVHVTDWFGVLAWYGHNEYNWIGNAMGEDKGDQIAGVLNFQVIPGSHIMLQVEKSNMSRSTGEEVDFLRTYLMWRTIF